MITLVQNKLQELSASMKSSSSDWKRAKYLFVNGQCQVLSHTAQSFEVLVNDDEEESEEIILVDKESASIENGKGKDWSVGALAALMEIESQLQSTEPKPTMEGKAYTREGMMKRALKERRDKAETADYKISFADNIYGEHTLANEKGVKYKITLRDFENETGYINNPDLKTNKLGTTKHILYAFNALKKNKKKYASLGKTYPFVEIYLDPQYDYQITWHYPHPLKSAVGGLIKKYFNTEKHIPENQVKDFLSFIQEASSLTGIVIRPEVEEKVKKAWDREALESIRKTAVLDFSPLKVDLFPYQKEGVAFATFKEGAIIADEMGLGKTLQAIATAVMKKEWMGFKKTLVICPASLKEQWKNEIHKYSHEKAEIADGMPTQRRKVYQESDAYFIILNYETVLRDFQDINRMEPDFIILDEAQKIKNFSSITAQGIKWLKKKHALVITGTPIENRLTDLYSIVQFIDESFLSPLWEFSYQHCYFGTANPNKITGYYNLQQLKDRLNPILIRREKRTVLKDLPNITEITVPVTLHPEQLSYHTEFAQGIGKILSKRYLTPFDVQKIMMLMNSMRMVCDSTFLIDKESYHSPKLAELRHILLEKMGLKESKSKVIIFSEWVTMLNLIGKMLHEEGIGFVQLSGKVAVKNRDKLVKKFESDERCQVFLSTEAGGAGLNLQVADTVINFELPWNPSKKNQRIGRIDRLGQRSRNLTIINFFAKNSVEEKIVSGLWLKQNLFDGVLSPGSQTDHVDFSSAGRAQFLQDLKAMIEGFTTVTEQVREEGLAEETVSIQAINELEVEAEAEIPNEPPLSVTAPENKAAEMEKVLNQGMGFFAGLFKMATGKDMGFESQAIQVDQETGEVVMRFKLPKL